MKRPSTSSTASSRTCASNHCSAAIGYVLCLAPFSDLDAIIHEADEKMYRDKKKKHMCREDE